MTNGEIEAQEVEATQLRWQSLDSNFVWLLFPRPHARKGRSQGVEDRGFARLCMGSGPTGDPRAAAVGHVLFLRHLEEAEEAKVEHGRPEPWLFVQVASPHRRGLGDIINVTWARTAPRNLPPSRMFPGDCS